MAHSASSPPGRSVALPLLWSTIILLCHQFQLSQGFTTNIKNIFTLEHVKNESFRYHPSSSTSSSSFSSHLFMSSVQSKDRSTQKKQFELPPLPEDPIVLGGDILALFTYTFLDHFVTAMLIANAKEIYTEPNALGLPVWSDVVSNNFGPSLLTAITTQQQMADISGTAVVAEFNEMAMTHHYAPCLENCGVSAVLLGSCWLLSGYFNHAFTYKNTISCHPSHALLIAGRTWFFTALMMVGLAMWSDVAFCGCHCAPDAVRGLTKADTDFIFDSFSVLIAWRFVAASLLGGLM